MNSIIYGTGNKHSRKNETKSKKTECRGWDSGWGYCSRMQKVTKQKKNPRKPQETSLCWLSSSQNRLEFCLGLFSLLVLSRLAKFLSNSSNSKASCGYRSVSVSAITELHIPVFPSVTTKQS